MITGILRVFSCDRNFLSTSSPSILGSRMSRKMMSGDRSPAFFSPSSPSSAVLTRYPSSSSLRRYISRTDGSSSTRRTSTRSSSTWVARSAPAARRVLFSITLPLARSSIDEVDGSRGAYGHQYGPSPARHTQPDGATPGKVKALRREGPKRGAKELIRIIKRRAILVNKGGIRYCTKRLSVKRQPPCLGIRLNQRGD